MKSYTNCLKYGLFLSLTVNAILFGFVTFNISMLKIQTQSAITKNIFHFLEIGVKTSHPYENPITSNLKLRLFITPDIKVFAPEHFSAFENYFIKNEEDDENKFQEDNIEPVFNMTDIKNRNFSRNFWCDQCFVHDFDYVIKNDQICKRKNESDIIELLILIFTRTDASERRTALRSTWLSISNNNTANVRYVFLLGMDDDQSKNDVIKSENKVYNDIIQENFKDSYDNLTYKTMMGYKWSTESCSSALYVFKTDDDVYVNVPAILRVIIPVFGTLLHSQLGGRCWNEGKPVRDKTSKLYVSERMYPLHYYPPICSGTGYITSMDVIHQIYNISRNVPFFPLEDVYIALCAEQLRIGIQDIQGFFNWKIKYDSCVRYKKTIFTIHNLSAMDLFIMWSAYCPSSQPESTAVW